MVTPRIKSIIIFTFFCNFVYSQENDDQFFIEYFKKSIHVVLQDSTDSLSIRYTIFEIIKSKKITKNYDDIIKLIGLPIHRCKKKDKSTIIFYPISPSFIKDKGGSDLYVLFLDENGEIIIDLGFIYFIESDEDFYYWISKNLPSESEEGDENCPPRYRRN